MWHLVKKLPWRGILLAILINAFLVGCMPWDTEVVMTLQSVTVIPR